MIELELKLSDLSIEWVSGDLNVLWSDYQVTALTKAAKYGYTIQLIKAEVPMFIGGSSLFTVEVRESGIILTPIMLIEGGEENVRD